MWMASTEIRISSCNYNYVDRVRLTSERSVRGRRAFHTGESGIAMTQATSPDSDAARGERMRYRIDRLLSDPWRFLPSYSERYAVLLEHAKTLTPLQAYAMPELLGRDSSRDFPDMPPTAELQFPEVNKVDAKSQVGWYYFAGHCEGVDGKRYGVLCMLFRNALMPPVMAEHF